MIVTHSSYDQTDTHHIKGCIDSTVYTSVICKHNNPRDCLLYADLRSPESTRALGPVGSALGSLLVQIPSFDPCDAAHAPNKQKLPLLAARSYIRGLSKQT